MNYSFEIIVANLLGILPQLLAGVIAIIVGFWLSKLVKNGVGKVVKTILSSAVFRKTPIEQSIKSEELEQHLDEIFGSIAYWLVLLLSIYVAASIWGLSAVSGLLASIFGYSPRVISALIVLLLGALLAGFAEKLIKNSLMQFDASSARAAGKITSYAVMIMAVLIAVSEIGIAREFILIAFIGLVFSLSLAFGLAVGLGGQSAVAGLLGKWIEPGKKGKN